MRIIYLDIDSLRPDHMSCYGYQRHTTPTMDAIAARGVRFNRAYCAASPCVPARASFISGRFAINHGALSHWGPGCHFEYPEGPRHSEATPLFSRYLRKGGYRTITFSSFADRHHAWWFLGGWDEAHTFTLRVGTENADEVNAAVLPWLKAHGREENYFLHIQYWDPHTLYTCPQAYVDQFADEHVVITALKRKSLELNLTQRHRGEEDLVVAAASILARQTFVEGLEKLGEEYSLELPKGASAKTIEIGRKFVKKY